MGAKSSISFVVLRASNGTGDRENHPFLDLSYTVAGQESQQVAEIRGVRTWSWEQHAKTTRLDFVVATVRHADYVYQLRG